MAGGSEGAYEEASSMKRSWIFVVACVVLVLVFAASAVTKILFPFEFAEALGSLNWFPVGLIIPTGVVLVILEGALVAMLLLPAHRVRGVKLTVVVMATFIAFSLIARLTGAEAPCPCFPKLMRLPLGSDAEIARDVLIMAVAGLALLLRPRRTGGRTNH